MPTADELAGESGSGGGTGGTSQGSSCPGTAGPSMVHIGGACIDSTEVTASQYDAFLKAKVDPATNPDVTCQAVNTTYQPSTWPNGAVDERPVVFVDWCDAAGFCAWAGKRLCGGPGGVQIESEGYDPPDPKQDEWFGACTNGGTTEYPYGDSPSTAACNRAPEGPLAQVKSFPACHGLGAYSAIWDLGGNADEWVNVCHVDYCRTVGGAIGISSDECGTSDVLKQEKTHAADNLGFRCCANGL